MNVGKYAPFYFFHRFICVSLHDGVTATEEEVKDFCRGKIARHKIPKYIFFVDTFPMTGSGKIQKFKLKDLGLKLLQEQGITPA